MKRFKQFTRRSSKKSLKINPGVDSTEPKGMSPSVLSEVQSLAAQEAEVATPGETSTARSPLSDMEQVEEHLHQVSVSKNNDKDLHMTLATLKPRSYSDVVDYSSARKGGDDTSDPNSPTANRDDADSGFFPSKCNSLNNKTNVDSIMEQPQEPNREGMEQGSTQSKHHKTYEELIQEMIDGFKLRVEKGDEVITGVCYQTMYMAIGIFECTTGGELRFQGCDTIRLEIPPGFQQADKPVLIYMYLENYDNDTCFVSPRVNCGPDGMKFLSPVSLQLPHCVTNPRQLTVSCREKIADNWGINQDSTTASIIQSQQDVAVIEIHHFTGYTLSAPPNAERHFAVAVFINNDMARIYITPGYTTTVPALLTAIHQEEENLGFKTRSPWSEFILKPGQGDMIIEAYHQHALTQLLFKRFDPVSEKTLLCLTSNLHKELINNTAEVITLDIKVKQANNSEQSISMCVKLGCESRSQQPDSPLPNGAEPPASCDDATSCCFHSHQCGGPCTCVSSEEVKLRTINSRNQKDSAYQSSCMTLSPLMPLCGPGEAPPEWWRRPQ